MSNVITCLFQTLIHAHIEILIDDRHTKGCLGGFPKWRDGDARNSLLMLMIAKSHCQIVQLTNSFYSILSYSIAMVYVTRSKECKCCDS